jgi:hypothetical protein
MPVDALQAMPVVHAWNDDDPYVPVGEPDPALVEALLRLSPRAKKAFATAAGEWIVFRFGELSDDPGPRDYLESCWAGVIRWKLGYLWDPGRDRCDGPVRGPLDMMVRALTNCHRVLKLLDGQYDAALVAKLALHVIPEPADYLAWQKEAVARLTALYTFDRGNPSGPPVPRQAVDPGVPLADVAPDKAEPLLNAFVNGLDFDRNGFLNRAGLAA